MIHYQQNIQSLTSFRVSAPVEAFAVANAVASFQEILTQWQIAHAGKPVMILGGGSNMLFTKPFAGLVIKNELTGIQVTAETADYWQIECGGGENWHQFVLHTLNNGMSGLENLSLIPGSVGAAPIQNIGAYGIEMVEFFHSLEALHLRSFERHVFSKSDCCFGYRDSVFKHQYKGLYAILKVSFRLPKLFKPNTQYGALEQELTAQGLTKPTAKDISNAVINIRRRKLPDPAIVGNAGSFFKNPVISATQYNSLKHDYAEMPGYLVQEGEYKIPAAWLIEQTGWKGKRWGDFGVHPNQALVLVNYGNATGAEIYQLSEDIIASVFQKFKIRLEREVNIL